jgi:SAM-dependent methyltransferase
MIPLERAAGVELLDDPAARPELVCSSLRNIERANRWFGGAAAVRYGLARALRSLPPGRELSLLDVGTGSGDLPRMARAWCAARGVILHPIGLERHTAAAHMAGQNGLQVVAGDASGLPFRDRSIDLVLLSQVAHHFAPAAIVRLLKECARVSRHAVIVSDLRRSALAALGFRMAGAILGFDADTLRDGITSLRRGFSPASLSALLGQAGLPAPVVRRPGARLVAVCRPAH